MYGTWNYSKCVFNIYFFVGISSQLNAQASVTIQVINLPEEFNGDELALAGTLNDWNNIISRSVVADNALELTFEAIDLTPLDAGWQNKPEGANTAFSFFEPGTWDQIIVGNYGSNDNNFRLKLEEGIANTVVIDAQYSITEPPWLMIDIKQPSLMVNGDLLLPPPTITNASIIIKHLPSEFEGQSLGLVGSVVQGEQDMIQATVTNNSVNFSFEDIELSVMGSDWEQSPLDANASFILIDPQTLDQRIVGNYDNKDNYFRVRLAESMNNKVVIDAWFSSGDSPLKIDKDKGISVNDNLQVPNRAIDPTKFAWPGGKWKALIMSYDDGPSADTQMVDLFNAHGIVGTFSLTSSFFGKDDFLLSSQVSDLFEGHEVANHSEHHPYLAQGDTTSIKSQIKNCGDVLSNLVGYDINGMAYPFGGSGTGAYDYRVIDIAQNLGIRYARTTNDTRSIEIPRNIPDGLMQWDPTINDWDGIKYADQLLEWDQERMALLFMWGHSHFLDDAGWARMNTICGKLGNKGNIWYAKNIEVADYIGAINGLIFINGTVYNPSSIPVWMKTEDGFEIIEPIVLSTAEEQNEKSHLSQNYPNPSNGITTINFCISESGPINLALYDLQGRLVQTIMNKHLATGAYRVEFDTKSLEEGVYIYRLESNTFQESKFLVVSH